MNKEYIHKDTRTDEPLQVQIETLTRWQDPAIYEKDKEIERLTNIVNKVEDMLQSPWNIECVNQNNEFLNKIKALKEGNDDE